MLIHRHQVFVQEADEVDFVLVVHVPHHFHDVFRAVVTNGTGVLAWLVKMDRRFAILVFAVPQVAGDSQMKTVAANQRASRNWR